MDSTTIFRLRFNRNYTTFVKTSRGHIKVDFTPIVLFGRTENSQFGTADKEVIEGLKKHEHFGSLFYIETDGEEVSQVAKAPAKRSAPVTPKSPEGDGNSPVAGDIGPYPGKEDEDGDKDRDDSEVHDGDGSGSEDDDDPDGEAGKESVLVHDTTVTSKNKAIAYLLEKHGAKFSQTADIAAMKQEAREKHSLVFDNWK